MVKTEQYRSVGDAIADYNKGEMHLLIFDGAPAASKTKLQILRFFPSKCVNF
jgi:chromosome partitioning protein